MPSQQKKTNFCKFWLVNQRARGQVSDQQLYNLDYAKKQLILFLIASTYWMGRMGIFYLPFTPFAIRDRNYGTDRSALINVPGASWTSSKYQFFLGRSQPLQKQCYQFCCRNCQYTGTQRYKTRVISSIHFSLKNYLQN